ncbi:MAG: tRNA lysidine(34) synthetase TilS [Synergistaceae bacterium]|jgi:tRNA(Ile)-lysidine synthase|nr:tRNA lysidine(34) synthetase TilS [Synergistaceae bacterium]
MSSSLAERLVAEVESAGARQGWLDASGVLVALSGGGDSMAMLSLLRRSSFRGVIAAAHLEHGLRGESSLQDAAFAEEYCKRESIPCFVSHVDVTGLRLPGESAEMAGRRARYDFFKAVRGREGIPFTATAHNSDDAVETMVYNFFRGAGTEGLAGIPERRDSIVRPVIRCSGEELRQFLREENIPWREDETNSENHYTRNRIRNQLLPWVRANINESAGRALLGLAGEASEDSSVFRSTALIHLALISRDDPCAMAAWHTPSALRLPDRSLARVIREQGRILGLPALDRRRTAELSALFRRRGSWRFQWAEDVEVCGDSHLTGWLRRSALKSPGDALLLLSCGEVKSLGWGRWNVELSALPRFSSRGRRGVWSAEIAVPASVNSVRVASADSFVKKNNSRFYVKMPWWKSRIMPVISIIDGPSHGGWLPGVRSAVRGEGDYVIIAKVSAMPREGERE